MQKVKLKRQPNWFHKLYKNFKEALSGEERDYTTGNLNRAIFMLSVPMILEMVMESLFAVVDIFFVGKVSVDAVATIGLTESVMLLVYSTAIGLSMATTAMVARRVGEKNKEDAADATVQSVIIATTFSVLISVVGIFAAEDILRWMGGSEALIAEGKGYAQLMLGGNITIMLLFLLNAAFRGAGDASLAMRSLWLANGLNIILDPIFIFGWGPIEAYGVTGAAIATNIGRGVGVVYQLYHLLKGNGVLRVTLDNLKVNMPVIKRMLQVSIGGMGQFLIGSASWIFLVRIISVFGSEVVAGYTISFRIIVFTILPSWGMANAAATLVGQHLGAKLPERAEQSVWRCAFYNMVFLAIVSVIFIAFAEQFIGIFSSEPEVIYYGTMSLRYICMAYMLFAYGMVVSQAFNGAGDTKTPTIINLFCYWMLQIPLAYALSVWLDWGPMGVFLAIAVAESALAVVAILVFRQGKWKTVQI